VQTAEGYVRRALLQFQVSIWAPPPGQFISSVRLELSVIVRGRSVNFQLCVSAA
jgi:hypothetical protein